MGFDIMSLQKDRGPVQARSKADEGRAVLKYIDVDDLVPSEDNFYSMSDIEELAGLIELSGGVKQPALVVPLGGGKYKAIAGHRRRLASLLLVKQGKEKYRKMPCMVEADEREPGADAAADELRAIDEAILLITTNGQREKTGRDKVEEATRLRELLERKRKFENIPGEARKIIAEWMGTTPAQVGRYDSIAKHLAAPFRHLFEQGKINISVAYELSTMENGWQYNAYDEYLKKGGLSIEDVKRKKKEAEETEKIRQRAKDAAVEETPNAEREPPPVQPGPPVTMVTADEIGPAPTPEQTKELLERDRPASGAVVLPGSRPVKAGSAEDIWTHPENAGKVVDFPAPPSPTPAPDAPEPDQTPERMSGKRAAFCLEDLREYCEGMMGADGEKPETWAEYADALTVAIDAMRK